MNVDWTLYRQIWLSPKRLQNASKIWIRNESKTNTSSHMLLDHLLCIRNVAVAFRSEEVFLKKGPSLT